MSAPADGTDEYPLYIYEYIHTLYCHLFILLGQLTQHRLLDWEAYLQEDMTTSTRINAFLWNRISQGYSRVMKDEPPTDGWRAWRAGHRDREPKLYRDPASSPVRELPSELGEAAAAVAERAQARQARCEAEAVAPAVVVAASSSSSETAVGSQCGVGVNEDQDGANVDRKLAALTGPSHSQEWASPSLKNCQVHATITDGPGRLHPAGRRTSLIIEHTAPDNMEIGLVQCIFYPKGTKKLGKDAPSHTVVVLNPSYE
jgi:hypothetical protein